MAPITILEILKQWLVSSMAILYY